MLRFLCTLLEELFDIVADEFELCENYQKRAKVYGDAFEAYFQDIKIPYNR